MASRRRVAAMTHPHSAVPTLTDSEWLELRRLRRFAGREHARRKDRPRTAIDGVREMRQLRELIASRALRGPEGQSIHFRKKNRQLKTRPRKRKPT